MSDQPMFYVAEDRSQPGAAFASRVADGKHPREDAKTLADWARRGAVVKLVDGDTMMRMLSAWKRPGVRGEGQA